MFEKENAVKQLLKISAILDGLLAPCMVCLGQSSASKSSSSAPNTPEPAAEMQSLTKAIAGKWYTTYKFEPGDMMPKGGDGDGEQVWRTGPGGFTLMEEEHVHTSLGEVFLFALHWWDKSTKSLRGLLCNDSGPATCNVDSYFNSSIQWDGKQLVIDFQFPENGKKMMWHEVWSDFTPTSFTQTRISERLAARLREP
jgi:hypothetical protein